MRVHVEARQRGGLVVCSGQTHILAATTFILSTSFFVSIHLGVHGLTGLLFIKTKKIIEKL